MMLDTLDSPREDVTTDENYVGVVAGGYEEEIETDQFTVVVHPQAAHRYSSVLGINTILRIETDVVKPDNSTFKFITFGIVEDVRIIPSAAFINSKDMSRSDYYKTPDFPFSSTSEDALRLIVKSIGHVNPHYPRDIYGPTRPPERESKAYLANPDEVRLVIMRDFSKQLEQFTLGAYSTPDGIYRPVTSITLPYNQIFLHGAIFATTGWGKTMLIKHLIQEFLSNSQTPPSIIVFNLKHDDFYQMDMPLDELELEQMRQRNLDAVKLLDDLNYKPAGIPRDRYHVYPISSTPSHEAAQTTTLRPHSIHFEQLGTSEEDLALFNLILENLNLTATAITYLMDYYREFKRHFTRNSSIHEDGQPGTPFVYGKSQEGNRQKEYFRAPVRDKLSSFLAVLRWANSQVEGRWVKIFCSHSNCYRNGEVVSLHKQSVESILPRLNILRSIGIFDVGQDIDIERLCIGGNLHVIDVVPIKSAIGQEIFIGYVLHRLFQYVNQRLYDPEKYHGVVIFLDEAWRFFRMPSLIDKIEVISRMGRSLKVGLWLADQSVPTSQSLMPILNNIRTVIAGAMAIGIRDLRKLIPLDERWERLLSNVRSGTGVFFNQEFSRIPITFTYPPARCYHHY